MAKWTEEITNKLIQMVGDPLDVITADLVRKAASSLDFSNNSVSAKLRNLGYKVESLAKLKTKTFTDDESEQLLRFLVENSGKYTVADIAAAFHGGKFAAKEIQGKVLSLEATDLIKPTPKVEVQKTYSDKEEALVLQMVKNGDYIEDIAEAVGREVNSVRGKALSLLRNNPDLSMPKQRTSHAKSNGKDPLESLEDLSVLTVDEIAESIGKTPRGVKTMLTHRGLDCKNYNGSKKREKIDSAKEAAV